MAGEIAAKRHEFIGVLVLTLAVLLFICLVSYDASDSSFNALSYKAGSDNMVGRIGAYVSDALFQFLGYSAYLLLCPLAILSWKLVRGREVNAPYFRTLGFFLILASVCTALQLAPPSLLSLIRRRDVNFVPGGVTGSLLSQVLLPNLNRTGTVIVVTSAFVLGLLAATTFSLERAFRRLAAEQDPSKPGLLERFRRWRESRRPVRTILNIKPAGPAPLELVPRPAPVKPAPPPAIVEARPTAPAPAREGEPPRVLPPPDRARMRKFVLPPVELLNAASGQASAVDESELMERARQLAEKCAEFDVHGSITQIHPGPVVTTFEFKPDAGIKYARVTSLVDDLCLGIKAESIRIDRLPGKATVGIEVPNNRRETIMLRELIDSEAFRKSSSRLTLALGKLINGNPYVTELTRMPHLLIAGATGAGKSVALNCMITSVLYKAAPDEVRLILIDPKRLELGVYTEIPHLLTPIVTDPKEAAAALRWATSEMETRYKRLALHGVRNIEQYNALMRSTGRQLSLIDSNEPEGEIEKPLPYLLIVIDELADLMMVSLREVEESISRLAAMARAVGIHLILATQRPSVDIITGIIKANFPCRIAFKVATKVDSRTIIDSNGAEQLLGNGDMLFIPPGTSRLTRIHGAYVSEKETQAIVEHLRKQGRPSYDDTVLSYGEEEVDEAGNPIDSDFRDDLYNDAVRIVVSERRASTSLLQRRLSIGYGRAAKLIDMMYQNNLVGPADGSKPREVLVGMDYLDRLDTI
jgi:S-DNA-T family DNA segregation ATPase FtsK/SpoIIIE